MKYTFFTVGPSQLYPTVKKHITDAIKKDIPSFSHRGKAFKEIYKHTDTMLRNLMAIPSSHHIFFVASGHEAMERVLMNTVYKYSFHLVNGSFSEKFYKQAIALKKQPEKITAEKGEGFDFTSITIPKNTELICITQNETSTGTAIDMQDIYALKEKNPQALIAIDIVSSVPYIAINFDKIDIAFFSVQKGFGLPAGLGVLIVSDAAIKKAELLAEKNMALGEYHDFLTLHKLYANHQTTETPNVLAIYLLGKVAEDILRGGVEEMRAATEEKAQLLYNFFDNHPKYKPAVKNQFRSKTTLVINTKEETEKILEALKKKGYIVGKGYGDRKTDQIRIANFPAQTMNQVKNLIKSIETIA